MRCFLRAPLPYATAPLPTACYLLRLQMLLKAGADPGALLGCRPCGHPCGGRLLHYAAEYGMLEEAVLLVHM